MPYEPDNRISEKQVQDAMQVLQDTHAIFISVKMDTEMCDRIMEAMSVIPGIIGPSHSLPSSYQVAVAVTDLKEMISEIKGEPSFPSLIDSFPSGIGMKRICINPKESPKALIRAIIARIFNI